MRWRHSRRRFWLPRCSWQRMSRWPNGDLHSLQSDQPDHTPSTAHKHVSACSTCRYHGDGPSPGRVPGQWTLVWQILDRRCSPGHGRPPWLAAGLLHFLSDTWSPTPQVTGQDEKGVHALQPPSTETDRQRR